MYILQLNYWRGPIDAWTLYQNFGGPPPPQDRCPWFIGTARLVAHESRCISMPPWIETPSPSFTVLASFVFIWLTTSQHSLLGINNSLGISLKIKIFVHLEEISCYFFYIYIIDCLSCWMRRALMAAFAFSGSLPLLSIIRVAILFLLTW